MDITRRARLALLFLAPACGSLGIPTGPDDSGSGGRREVGALPAGGHHVLFIGNSLTYFNDLPGTLAAVAASVSDTIRVRTVAFPDYALIDHLARGEAQFALVQDRWEFVVLQQGPSTLAVNRDSLVLWTRMFAPLITAQGAKPALFMVWPDASRAAFFEACRLSYLAAADAVGGAFLPAGEVWRTALDSLPGLPLYGADDFHPSALGTYVAAITMYERFTRHDARALPATPGADGAFNGVPPGIDSVLVRFLQRTAHQVNLRYARY